MAKNWEELPSDCILHVHSVKKVPSDYVIVLRKCPQITRETTESIAVTMFLERANLLSEITSKNNQPILVWTNHQKPQHSQNRHSGKL